MKKGILVKKSKPNKKVTRKRVNKKVANRKKAKEVKSKKQKKLLSLNRFLSLPEISFQAVSSAPRVPALLRSHRRFLAFKKRALKVPTPKPDLAAALKPALELALKPTELSFSFSLRDPSESAEPSFPTPLAFSLPSYEVQAEVQNEARFAVHLNALSVDRMIRPDDLLRKSIEAFLCDLRSEHTRRAYGKDMKRFVKFLLVKRDKAKLQDIDRHLIIAYKEFLLSEKLQHSSIDRHLATLRSFFQWLVEDGLIDRSPASSVRFLNPKRLSSTVGFEDSEVKLVLAQPNLHTKVGALHYAILMVLFYCGLRRSEVCELRTKNLSVERKQKVLRLQGKGNLERLIVVTSPVWHALQHYFRITARSWLTDETLFRPVRNNRTGVLKKSLDPSSIFYIVRKYARQAGISNRVSPHSCRATAISNARDHKVPDRAIQEFAGWSSPDMITRYDKRKTTVEESAAHAIDYGMLDRSLPQNLPQTLDGVLDNALPMVEDLKDKF